MPDIQARLKLRTGTLAAWTSANPVLAAGEPGFEVDTAILRIGDGSTSFLSLSRFQTSDSFAATYQAKSDNLDGLSALALGANKLPYATGIGVMALTDLAPEARVFLSKMTKADQRTSMELEDGAITKVSASDNMTVNPSFLPTRAAVGAAILKVGGTAKRLTYTASATFVKEDYGMFPADRKVLVEAWGGGGGGQSFSAGFNLFAGGGGGGYDYRWIRWADIPSTVAIIIGAGGAVNADGGNTTFGSFVKGGGGFKGAVGDTGAVGSGVFPGGTYYGGGSGGSRYSQGNTTSGQTSQHGGNGGQGGSPGIAPGGGGGGQSTGARGEVRIWL